MDKITKKQIETNFDAILKLIEKKAELRDGIKETPKRVANMFEEIFDGYSNDVKKHVKLFKEKHDAIIISKNIEFYSMCEHHMLPFYGTVDIAYLPDETIIGLSKLARIANHFAHRLNVQEKLTTNIANFLMECDLKPLGVMVIIKAIHLCEVMRGVKQSSPITITSVVKGVFKDSIATRNETLTLLSMK